MRKLTRRDFLIISGTATASTFVLPKVSMADNVKNIGIQAYTLRDNMAKDPAATLKAIADAGYSYVEGYTTDKGMFFGYGVADFKKMLADLGLKMVSTHSGIVNSDTEVESHQKKLADAAEAGLKYIVLPWIGEEYRKTANDVKTLASKLNNTAKLAKSAGLTQCYHNHDFEFSSVDGQVIYDILLKETDPSLVKFELDIYWITKAQKDPLAYFSKYPMRFPLWHVKDMAKNDRNLNTEVGNGSIDWKPIFQKSKLCGLEYPLVEQENNYIPDFNGSVKASADYLKKFVY
ncbi:MAG: sugar phosphate isomerase/epimerase [Cytophagales bacterium]|nr:sugar phosphate isomerase/epimerase [Cytophagales bacterium]